MSRLVREVQLMEVLDHPNVVHLYETMETADSLYLVMEYVPGFNLDEHLQKRHGSLHEDEARLIFRQMVTAVDYIHSRWVVHRDLKAPNVLLKTNGEVKLADFGLGNRFGLQRLRTMCGSMLYYSPEIICEQKYIGPEVDCWCLGVTLFRMTAGFEPFIHARTFGELRRDVIHGNFPMPDTLSEGLKQTIQKCLSVDRRRRIALRVALKDDPWLNDYGRLDDLFHEHRTGYYGHYDPAAEFADVDEAMLHRMERERARRQCVRDLEDEKLHGRHIRKHVVYHPINPSTYFTGSAGHSSRQEENTQSQERALADLLQDLQLWLAQVRLRTATAPLVGSSLHQFFHKLKRPDSILVLSSAAYSANPSSIQPGSPTSPNASGFSSRLKKTTSTLSLASLYQRPKEHTQYYTMQCTPSRSTQPQDGKEEDELMSLVLASCRLLGITYQQESRTKLTCVLTLRNYILDDASSSSPPPQSPKPPNPEDAQPSKRSSRWFSFQRSQEPASPNPTSSTASLRKNKAKRTSHASQTDSAAYGGSSTYTTRSSWLDRLSSNNSSNWSRPFKRLSMPFAWSTHSAHLHSSMPIRPPAAAAAAASTSTQPPLPTQRSSLLEDDQEDKATNKEGVALFTIDTIVLPRSKEDDATLMAVRFTKVKGSSKVFKLATGWLHGVLSSSPVTANATPSSSHVQI
ncbi:kinase-like protein [Hesseltinella vesiculosa]|uniref:Kinase-like protein n=1 Tax=Hesseltinella vesiculosa TaxID=101127 RepID=A0A1X2GLT8_9FUNG|nr:kinase-like protein [Hesseltinella vesiculosa]